MKLDEIRSWFMLEFGELNVGYREMVEKATISHSLFFFGVQREYDSVDRPRLEQVLARFEASPQMITETTRQFCIEIKPFEQSDDMQDMFQLFQVEYSVRQGRGPSPLFIFIFLSYHL